MNVLKLGEYDYYTSDATSTTGGELGQKNVRLLRSSEPILAQ